VWNFSFADSSSFAPNRSFMIFAQILRAALNFATSSRKSLLEAKKKEK
jgi:hypothetical protein